MSQKTTHSKSSLVLAAGSDMNAQLLTTPDFCFLLLTLKLMAYSLQQKQNKMTKNTMLNIKLIVGK